MCATNLFSFDVKRGENVHFMENGCDEQCVVAVVYSAWEIKRRTYGVKEFIGKETKFIRKETEIIGKETKFIRKETTFIREETKLITKESIFIGQGARIYLARSSNLRSRRLFEEPV